VTIAVAIGRTEYRVEEDHRARPRRTPASGAGAWRIVSSNTLQSVVSSWRVTPTVLPPVDVMAAFGKAKAGTGNRNRVLDRDDIWVVEARVGELHGGRGTLPAGPDANPGSPTDR
jgi:hypothetical protein